MDEKLLIQPEITEEYENVLEEQENTLLEGDGPILGANSCTKILCLCDVTIDTCGSTDLCTSDGAVTYYYLIVWAAKIYGTKKPNHFCTYRITTSVGLFPISATSSSIIPSSTGLVSNYSMLNSGGTTYFWKSGTTVSTVYGGTDYHYDAVGPGWAQGHTTSSVTFGYAARFRTSSFKINPAVLYGASYGTTIKSVYLNQAQYTIHVENSAGVPKAGYHITFRTGSPTGGTLLSSGYTTSAGYCTFVTSAQNVYYLTAYRDGSVFKYVGGYTPPTSGYTWHVTPSVSGNLGFCLINLRSACTFGYMPRENAIQTAGSGAPMILTEDGSNHFGETYAFRCLTRHTYGHYKTDYGAMHSLQVHDETLTYTHPRTTAGPVNTSQNVRIFCGSTTTITSRGNGLYTATISLNKNIGNSSWRYSTYTPSWPACSRVYGNFGQIADSAICPFMLFRIYTAGSYTTRFFGGRAKLYSHSWSRGFEDEDGDEVAPMRANTLGASSTFGSTAVTVSGDLSQALRADTYSMNGTYNDTDTAYGVINRGYAAGDVQMSCYETVGAMISAYTGSYTVTAQTAYCYYTSKKTDNTYTWWYEN